MKILVTGASGFLGRHVVTALRDRGHDVRALVRPSARLASLAWSESVEVFRADLRSGNLAPAFSGVEALVHLAAAVSGPEDVQFASTVVATERLLDAMAHTACRRVILASSFAVYDWSTIRGTLDEESPIEPSPDVYERDGYTIAKWWQERITRRMARAHGWDLTVLRPGSIWGRDHADLPCFGYALGPFQIAIGPRARCPITHVENCADLFALAAAHPRAVGETFNVVDGPGHRIWSIVRTHLRAVAAPRWRVPLPYWPTYALVRAAYGTLFNHNAKLPHILVPVRFESRLKPLRYTNRRAREVLGWHPPLTFAESLARTYGPDVSGR